MDKVFRGTRGERTLQAEKVQGHRGGEQHDVFGRASLLIRWYNGGGMTGAVGKEPGEMGRDCGGPVCHAEGLGL